ncbi:hypothetical protein M885DRAFT_547449 [Pelagophyceae sp. CCMP2097]|nr:hypothetical protein M885DRAFT_547449 [Pelagophyceae sp. CCMP2097]|mmetsp:Transcript_9508/g.31434  ORF Transcript_9508/g.31434 Transcript_9508/m.31434 type:complete len:143 (+) Transcript_9508:35-463(+)
MSAVARTAALARLRIVDGAPLWKKFWRWTLQPRLHWRESATEATVICTVFAITGSSSVAVVRPVLKETTGIEGSLRDGPWSYRISSILLVSPIYSVILVSVGTVFGRHRFFASMAQKIVSRFVPGAFKPKAPICATVKSTVR